MVLNEFPSITLHEVPRPTFEIGSLSVEAAFICHPGPTVGYRISEGRASLAYLPDHEPALGAKTFPQEPEWTSGFSLSEGIDLLIHDAQFTAAEYPHYVGWGHSSIDHSVAFAELAGTDHLVTFHHAPSRDDDALERSMDDALTRLSPACKVTAGAEGTTFELNGAAAPDA